MGHAAEDFVRLLAPRGLSEGITRYGVRDFLQGWFDGLHGKAAERSSKYRARNGAVEELGPCWLPPSLVPPEPEYPSPRLMQFSLGTTTC